MVKERRRVLVTGGVRGIGLGVVRELLRSGYDVTATGRAITEEFHAIQVDNSESVEFISAEFPKELGKVTDVLLNRDIVGLVNNAGVAFTGLHASISAEAVRETLDVDLLTPMILSQAAVRGFMQRKSEGSIVNVSSPATAKNWRGYGAYAAAKSGLEKFSAILAKEVLGLGISVNCVAPGFVNTRMTSGAIPRANLTAFRGRDVSTNEVGRLVATLMAADSSITGQVIRVDGGVSI